MLSCWALHHGKEECRSARCQSPKSGNGIMSRGIDYIETMRCKTATRKTENSVTGTGMNRGWSFWVYSKNRILIIKELHFGHCRQNGKKRTMLLHLR